MPGWGFGDGQHKKLSVDEAIALIIKNRHVLAPRVYSLPKARRTEWKHKRDSEQIG